MKNLTDKERLYLWSLVGLGVAFIAAWANGYSTLHIIGWSFIGAAVFGAITLATIHGERRGREQIEPTVGRRR